jgi:hypothetical protein
VEARVFQLFLVTKAKVGSFIGGDGVISPAAEIAGKLGVNVLVKIELDFGDLPPNRHN